MENVLEQKAQKVKGSRVEWARHLERGKGEGCDNSMKGAVEVEKARSLYHTEGTDRKPQPGDVCRVTHLVGDYCHPRVVEVQPGWNLPVGDYEDIPNPWCMPLDRPQRVPQLFVIFEAAGGHIFILLGLGGRGDVWHMKT